MEVTKNNRATYVKIYFNEEKEGFQIVRPTSQFNGDWKGLVQACTKSNDEVQNYYSFEIR